LTADDAARLMFPDSERIRQETLTLTPEQKALVQERIGWQFPEASFEVYIGETNGTRDGYAILQHTIGKHKPMTYMVGMDNAGKATSVEVLVYRESRGSEVRTKRFNYQYEGKTIYDPIRINRDIINISGATMSVRSMSAGVKRALVLVDEAYLKPVGLGSQHPSARKTQKSFLETLLGF
ncbi:MAG: FMN-binding protein, partial [Nitrospiraceae bacterium]